MRAGINKDSLEIPSGRGRWGEAGWPRPRQTGRARPPRSELKGKCLALRRGPFAPYPAYRRHHVPARSQRREEKDGRTRTLASALLEAARRRRPRRCRPRTDLSLQFAGVLTSQDRRLFLEYRDKNTRTHATYFTVRDVLINVRGALEKFRFVEPYIGASSSTSFLFVLWGCTSYVIVSAREILHARKLRSNGIYKSSKFRLTSEGNPTHKEMEINKNKTGTVRELQRR